MRLYDHIDLRVPKLAAVSAFYQHLLPALGFTRQVPVEGWLQYEAEGDDSPAFFGITESAHHSANENRIAFWAKSKAEVNQLGQLIATLDARHIEGPMDYEPGYYALFFEDPCGNRFEVCHRTRPTN